MNLLGGDGEPTKNLEGISYTIRTEISACRFLNVHDTPPQQYSQENQKAAFNWSHHRLSFIGTLS